MDKTANVKQIPQGRRSAASVARWNGKCCTYNCSEVCHDDGDDGNIHFHSLWLISPMCVCDLNFGFKPICEGEIFGKQIGRSLWVYLSLGIISADVAKPFFDDLVLDIWFQNATGNSLNGWKYFPSNFFFFWHSLTETSTSYRMGFHV